jgi:glucan phosphoethanolaminetransferase (alkaline phosphatase superfamily)
MSTRRAAGISIALVSILIVGSFVFWSPRDDSIPRNTRPDIILISIDTLRADHLGAYGYGRKTSPAIIRSTFAPTFRASRDSTTT